MELDWFEVNRAAVQQRVAWLKTEMDGVVYVGSSALHDLVVTKSGSWLELGFVDPTSDEVMSRLDLDDPLNLLSPYMQSMMLGLLWRPEPQQAYLIGFGGGNIPLVLHHYYPELTIESAEIDPEVVRLACAYFGVVPDDRLRVAVEDGRAGLERGMPGQYDMVFVDAFRGTGYGPYHLGTLEFFQLCKERLVDGGVLAINLYRGDFLCWEKMKTLMTVFPEVLCVPLHNAAVLFASNARPGDIEARLAGLQERHHFTFPFVTQGRKLMPLLELAAMNGADWHAAPILRDGELPPGYCEQISGRSTIFRKALPEDLCPCGSGKLLKVCHGRDQ